MKYSESFIAWTPNTDRVRVGPLLNEGDDDWSYGYAYTGGGCIYANRLRTGAERDLQMMLDFHTIVVRDHVPVAAAHQAFLAFIEYRKRISPEIEGAASAE